MSVRFKIKRGDPFSRLCTRRDAAGDPVSLAGTTVLSQVRGDGFVDDLTVTVLDSPGGQFRVSISGTETLNWPLDVLSWDVRFEGNNPGSTDTVKFTVEEDVTRVA